MDKFGFGIFQRVGRPIVIHIDLDNITHNARLMRKLCKYPDKVGVMAVLKSDCYGHGAAQVGRHLLETGGADRLAVAILNEGEALRLSGITGPIHIFGNGQSWEMERCLKFDLIPSISDVSAVWAMSAAMKSESTTFRHDNSSTGYGRKQPSWPPRGAVHIKLDTGMNRNGCQPCELKSIIQECDDNDVPVEGIFSHLANFADRQFTQKQLNLFEECITPYKDRCMLFHIAAAGPVLHRQGSHYDMIRPGISLLGMPPDDDVDSFAALGFKPSLEVKGYPTLIKLCAAGSKIGYGCAYTCGTDEWIATFPIGYADGYWRDLSLKAQCILRDKTGEKCPVVGKISMDAIMVRLPCRPNVDEIFTIITADFDPDTSVMAVCRRVNSIPQEVLARLSTRIPRVFTSHVTGKVEIIASINSGKRL